MLGFLVTHTLRVNNYIIDFLERDGKVPTKNNEERYILDLVQSVNNFSFCTPKNTMKRIRILFLKK